MNPGPGPQVEVQQPPDLDLDLGPDQDRPGSRLGPQYCSDFFKKISVINIHIRKSHLSLLCSPRWFKANLSANILKL